MEHFLNKFELISNCWQDLVLTNSNLLLWLNSEKDNQKASLVDALSRKVRICLRSGASLVFLLHHGLKPRWQAYK